MVASSFGVLLGNNITIAAVYNCVVNYCPDNCAIGVNLAKKICLK